MAIFVPDSAINSEVQETVSRASIRRMIQAGSSVLTVGSETEQNQLIAQVQASGIEPTATNPLYVFRTDTGILAVYNGTSWTLLTSGDADMSSTKIQGIAPFNTSTLYLVRNGNIVYCDGQLKTGTFSQGARNNIGIVPAGWRPSSQIYEQFYAASAVSWVNGSTSPYIGDSNIHIDPAYGNLSVYAGRTCTRIVVSCHWRI